MCNVIIKKTNEEANLIYCQVWLVRFDYLFLSLPFLFTVFEFLQFTFNLYTFKIINFRKSVFIFLHIAPMDSEEITATVNKNFVFLLFFQQNSFFKVNSTLYLFPSQHNPDCLSPINWAHLLCYPTRYVNSIFNYSNNFRSLLLFFFALFYNLSHFHQFYCVYIVLLARWLNWWWI